MRLRALITSSSSLAVIHWQEECLYPKEYDDWEDLYRITINATLCLKPLDRQVQELAPLLRLLQTSEHLDDHSILFEEL